MNYHLHVCVLLLEVVVGGMVSTSVVCVCATVIHIGRVVSMSDVRGGTLSMSAWSPRTRNTGTIAQPLPSVPLCLQDAGVT